MRLVGVDPAWKPESNGSAIAVGRLNDAGLDVEQLHGAVLGLACVATTILAADPDGVAIDGPLLIENETGRRACEKALSSVAFMRSALRCGYSATPWMDTSWRRRFERSN